MHFINVILALGTVVSALAVGAVCLLGLLVWVAGSERAHRN